MADRWIDFDAEGDDEELRNELEGQMIEVLADDGDILGVARFIDGHATVHVPSSLDAPMLWARTGDRVGIVETAALPHEGPARLPAPAIPVEGFDALRRLLADNDTNAPDGPSYTGRLDPTAVAANPSLAAGRPSHGRFPVDGAGRRYRATFLACDTLTYNRPGIGTLIDFEVTWEPLGWALDDWVRTDTAAPGVDRASSSAHVLADAGTESSRTRQETDEQGRSEQGGTETDQAMGLMAAQSSASRGFQAGIGAKDATGQARLGLDPIYSLALAVTGSIQLGFSAGSSKAETNEVARAHQRVRSQLEQSTHSLRADAARALSETSSTLTDERQVEALRNTGDGALNLALFSISRQWLVTTLVARKRPVALLPIIDGDQPFEEADVFVHRPILQEVLLDPSLAEALDAVAASYGTDDGPTRPTPLRAVEVQATFADEAEGRDSTAVIDVLFRRTGPDERVRWQLSDTRPGTPQQRSFVGHRNVEDFLGVAVQFRNPGRVRDRSMIVAELIVTGVDLDGKAHELLHTTDITVAANDNQTIAAAPTAPAPPPARSGGSERERVLTHLNANRMHYRLAIDLVRNPADRFERLGLGADPGCSPGTDGGPIDLNPVGIAGAHLAFIARGEEGDLTDDEQQLTRDLLSTPSGGVWMEAMTSAHRMPVPQDKEPAWSSLPTKDAAYPWPPLATPAYLAAAGLDPRAATETPEAAAPEVTLAGLAARLDKLQANLEKAAQKAKDAVPAKEAEKAPAKEAEKAPAKDEDDAPADDEKAS